MRTCDSCVRMAFSNSGKQQHNMSNLVHEPLGLGEARAGVLRPLNGLAGRHDHIVSLQ